MTPRTTNDSRSKAGFTLVEVLIATTLSGAVIAMVMSSFIFILRSNQTDLGKLSINRDIRHFTNEMNDNGSYANLFTIYKSFTDRTPVSDGLSGDFLVFEYRDENDSSLIKRIVGYYRSVADAAETGPVKTFEQFYTTPSSSSLFDLLPPTTSSGTHEEVAELSKGLSNGQLFYNFRKRSVVIRGQLIYDHGNTKEVSNTYNYTVTPRG